MSKDDKPINFDHIVESFELALEHHSEISDSAAEEVVGTVSEACANNEDFLMWEQDHNEFMSLLDGLLDSIYGNNGYDELIKQLDDLRERMEAKDK